MTPLDDLGISSENCPVDDSVGRLRRDWNGSSGVDRPFTIEAVADFAPCFCDGGPYISLYELIAHFRYWILRYAIHRVVM